MLLRNVFITIILFTPIIGYTQNCNYVKLVNEQGKREAFTIKDTPVAEKVNGRLNISVTEKGTSIFQVNRVDENLIKDTSLITKDVELVLISNQKNCTYKSNSSLVPVSLRIKCKNGARTGTKFRICATGKLYCNERSYRVKVRIDGKIPQPKFIRTY